MAALVLTSALLDATLSVGVYLQAPAEEIPDLSGAATQNIVTTLSGEPLSFNETSYQRYAGWDLDDFNESNGGFSAISVSGTQALTINGDRAFSLYSLSLPQSNTDPALILTITPAENDPFFDSDGVVYLAPSITARLLATTGLTLYGKGAVTLNASFANAVALDGESYSLEGNVADNTLQGNDSGGELRGLSGDDTLVGGLGNDYLYPGAGNDVLDGGRGTDTAIFPGPEDDYTISYLTDSTEISHLETGQINSLTNVEFFQFDDVTVEALFGNFTDIDSAENAVDEGAAAGTSVGITAAVGNATNTATYALVTDETGLEQSTDPAFQVDSQTGEVTVADGNLLDFEQRASETLYVRATLASGEFQVRQFSVSVNNIDEPAEGLVSITSLPREGALTNSTVIVSDPDAAHVEALQWQTGPSSSGSDWSDLAGANSSSVLIPDDQAYVGQYLRLKVTTTDALGGVTELFSGTNREILNVNDSPEGEVEIVGVPSEDQTLSASVTLTDEDGLGTFAYQWFADETPISGAVSQTYTVGPLDIGKQIGVTVSYTDGYGVDESVQSASTSSVSNTNDSPVGELSIEGINEEDQTLTAVINFTDEDGFDPQTVSYQWFADDSPISGAVGSALTLSQSVVGTQISVSGFYTDNFGTSEVVTSSSTASVTNLNDIPTGSVSILGAAQEDQTLSVESTLADEDGIDNETITYQWLSNGNPISGENNANLLVGESLVGFRISVNVSYVDNYGTAEAVTSEETDPVSNVNDVPQGGVTITGLAEEDETLSAANSLTDQDGLGEITYQWLVDGEPIVGATSSNFLLTQQQVGTVISVVASYTDANGTAESVSSDSTSIVLNVNDAPEGDVTISGVAREDEQLTLTSSLSDEDGMGSLSYQWRVDGSAISGATGASLLLQQAQVNGAISVAVTYTDGQGTVENVISGATGPIENVNDDPVGSVSIAGTAAEDQTLTAVIDFTDEDGFDSEALNYQWLSGDMAIAGATSAQLLLDQSLVGSLISIELTYTDNFGVMESLTSSRTSAVQNVNDSPEGDVLISGVAREDEILTVTDNLSDEDGLGDIAYQWLSNGTPISGAISSTLLLGQAQVGSTISVLASYTDGNGTHESVESVATSVVQNVNDAPTGSITLAGQPTEDQTLSIINTLSDEDGIETDSFVYQWFEDSTPVAGATDETFVLTQAQVGKIMRLSLSYTDLSGTEETVYSDLSSAIENVNDEPVGEVTISGSLAQGGVLSVSNTLSDEDGLGVISYQWYVDSSLAPGATGMTYTLTQAEVGRRLSVTAIYTDGFGTNESVSSATTSPIANVNDEPQGSVTLSGLSEEGQTLTAQRDFSDVDGIDEATVAYQWFANGALITGANGSTFVLGQAQVEKQITVVLTYTDNGGTNEQISSSATVAVANVNDSPEGSVTLSGDAREGQSLTAVIAFTDEDGFDTSTVSYEWRADDLILVGETGASLTLTQAHVTRQITVTIAYTDNFGVNESVTSVSSVAVENTNDAPEGNVVISGIIAEDQILTASNTLSDEDGLGTVTYQWHADGVSISGASGSTLLLGQPEVGKSITVVASYTDGFGANETVESAATSAVQNVNDAPTGSITLSGQLKEDQILSIINTLSDEDGIDTGSFVYQWLADNTPIPAATNATFLLTQAQVGKIMSFSLSYTDLSGTDETVYSDLSSSVENVNDAPLGSVVISGIAEEDQTLQASNTLIDEDGFDPETISYTWRADNSVIQGALGASTVTLSQAQVGTVITVTASYTDAFGAEETVDSEAVGPVANINDPPEGEVVVAGNPSEGQTLTGTNTITDEDGITSGAISYQWLADGNDIAGATRPSIELTQIEVGKRIRLRVDYIDDNGTSESVLSSETSLIINVNDTPSGSVEISGSLYVGDVLTATNTLDDEDGMGTVTYRWFVGGMEVATTVDGKLALVPNYFGDVVFVRALFTDGFGTEESVDSEVTGTIGDDTPPVVTLVGDSVLEVLQGGTFSDPGVSAVDDVAGDISEAVVIDGTVDTQVAGDYVITYSVEDPSGNLSSVVRTVTVISDTDRDGIPDEADAYPDDPNESQDSDGDGVGDNADVFPFDASETSDFDADGLGDNADPDDDNDGFPDPDENIVSMLSISAGGKSLCGTEREGVWCDVTASAPLDALSNIPSGVVEELAVADDRACLLRDGALTCWGASDGAAQPASNSLSNLTGYSGHLCAMDGNTARCWGKSVSQTTIPNVRAVAAGRGFTCALEENSSVTNCWTVAGEPLIGHFVDNATAIEAGNDMVCASGGFQEQTFIKCWRPSSWSSPFSIGVDGATDFAVGGDVCAVSAAGVICRQPSATSLGSTTSFDLQADEIVVGDQFSCARMDASLSCWGDAANDFDWSSREMAKVANLVDLFPLDASEWSDWDSDGIGDNADNDDDNDGISDNEDAFPLDNTESLDTDGDGVGNNSDDDDDGDGIADGDDAFPLDAGESLDTDGDGVGDVADAFPNDPTETLDTDGDGLGDNTDTDDDDDGFEDSGDVFPLDGSEWFDSDGDGIGNNADPDDDNDSVIDENDIFPLDATEWSDFDSDGVGDNSDTDDDNDGISDAEEILEGSNPFDPNSVPSPVTGLNMILIHAAIMSRGQ